MLVEKIIHVIHIIYVLQFFMIDTMSQITKLKIIALSVLLSRNKKINNWKTYFGQLKIFISGSLDKVIIIIVLKQNLINRFFF